MNVTDLVLEERYASARDGVFALLNSSSSYLLEVANAFIDVFSPIEDADHGPVLWSLMAKTTVRAQAAHFSVQFRCSTQNVFADLLLLAGHQNWRSRFALQGIPPILLLVSRFSQSERRTEPTTGRHCPSFSCLLCCLRYVTIA